MNLCRKIFFFCFQEFESCFLFACPKFLSPAPPPSDATGDYDYVKEAIKHQTQVFMDEVRQQKMLPTIRRFTDWLYILISTACYNQYSFYPCTHSFLMGYICSYINTCNINICFDVAIVCSHSSLHCYILEPYFQFWGTVQWHICQLLIHISIFAAT